MGKPVKRSARDGSIQPVRVRARRGIKSLTCTRARRRGMGTRRSTHHCAHRETTVHEEAARCRCVHPWWIVAKAPLAYTELPCMPCRHSERNERRPSGLTTRSGWSWIVLVAGRFPAQATRLDNSMRFRGGPRDSRSDKIQSPTRTK